MSQLAGFESNMIVSKRIFLILAVLRWHPTTCLDKNYLRNIPPVRFAGDPSLSPSWSPEARLRINQVLTHKLHRAGRKARQARCAHLSDTGYNSCGLSIFADLVQSTYLLRKYSNGTRDEARKRLTL